MKRFDHARGRLAVTRLLDVMKNRIALFDDLGKKPVVGRVRDDFFYDNTINAGHA
jgi:hypothetical protein